MTAEDIGTSMAARVFEERSKQRVNVEVHLSRDELAALLTEAARQGHILAKYKCSKCGKAITTATCGEIIDGEFCNGLPTFGRGT